MKRPWETFKAIPIRLTATNKMVDEEGKADLPYGRRQARTTANAVDPVRGCPGGITNDGRGCPWGCYSCESMKRYHRIFHIPVSMILKPELLRKDLENCPDDWIRFGINGDPGEDWNLTIQVARIVRESGKTPVILSRLWTPPTEPQLSQMANLGVVLHISICALDSYPATSQRLLFLKKYQAIGGKGIMRLVTFVFTDPEHTRIQNDLYNYGGPILEQPARLQRTNPNWLKVTQSRYHPYHTYTDKTKTTRWWTAGPQFSGSSCGDGCTICPNKCFTTPQTIKTPAPNITLKSNLYQDVQTLPNIDILDE